MLLEFPRCGGTDRQPQRAAPCQCVLGQPWVCHGPLQAQMQPLKCAAGVVEPGRLCAAAGLPRRVVGGAVLLNAGVFQMQVWRRRSATAAYTVLSVCEWPALGMSRATARSDAASAVCIRCAGACTGCCGRAGQVISEGGAVLLNAGVFHMCRHRSATTGAQSPTSVWVASPGHAMGSCKVGCSLCCVQQVWWGLHWGLRQGCAEGLWGQRFYWLVESSRGGGSTQQPQHTEPCQRVQMASQSGHAIGFCKVKYSHCSVQRVWWSLHWPG